MRKDQQPIDIDQLVINWHLTQICNYTCKYCYSSWDAGRAKEETFRDPTKTTALLKDLNGYFHPKNIGNALSKDLRWKSVRLSLAGGEPLLFPEETLRIAHEANDLGFEVSLITNGSHLNRHRDSGLSNALSTLGISIDSTDAQTNIGIGRASSGRVIDLDNLYNNIALFRRRNPLLRIKINTVVNALNWRENMAPVIEAIRPDKWKVLMALPVIKDDLAISTTQFNDFINRHQSLSWVMSTEDNQEMTESYIMIDPQGRFFQNQTNTNNSNPYLYSQPIIEVGAKKAFREIRFSSSKFANRYQTSAQEVIA